MAASARCRPHHRHRGTGRSGPAAPRRRGTAGRVRTGRRGGALARSSPRSRRLERPYRFLGVLILPRPFSQILSRTMARGPSCFRLRCRSRRVRDLPPALIVSIPLAASMAFSTPIGYQINLMVYGPGNYRFLDLARVGGLLQVLLWIVLLVSTPLVWPL